MDSAGGRRWREEEEKGPGGDMEGRSASAIYLVSGVGSVYGPHSLTPSSRLDATGHSVNSLLDLVSGKCSLLCPSLSWAWA